jgi:hypothetical protein
MIEDLKPLAEQLQQLQKKAYVVYKAEVENIISQQIKDNNTIELMLDYILGFCTDNQMLSLYKKLCRYYWNINPQSTANYINYYKEMWENQTGEN